MPREHLEWAAHAVVGYLVEAVLNWLEFGDPARDDRFVAATNQALRAGVRAWARRCWRRGARQALISPAPSI
jgi:hypothetical protein